MPQGLLSFQYEVDHRSERMTALGGLPLYLELAHVTGLIESIRKHLRVRDAGQGWTDVQVVLGIVLLNLAGGDCVDDLEVLERDAGFSEILRRAELHDLPRSQRRELARRWRKERRRAVPSPSAVRRYLEAFHDPAQEALRPIQGAFFPAPNEHLRALKNVHRDLVAFLQRRSPQEEATLDADATLIETHKSTAEHCYKGFRAYQPLNIWWAQQQLVLHTEFRDGNVPAGYQLLRVFQEALDLLPPGVESVSFRSDTAGYDHTLLRWLADPTKHPRFGVIPFAVSCDVTPQFKNAVAEVAPDDWKPEYRIDGDEKLPTKREWAEVCFVPEGMGSSKKTQAYRYIAIRELMDQQPLPGTGDQLHLPFQTMKWTKGTYKLFGLVTNREEHDGWDGNRVINWLHQRCGRSEEAHAVMKGDLAGGKLPSAQFGTNAAWWWMMILAFNLNTAMKRLVLGGSWIQRRLKAIRFHVIHIAGRLLRGGRQLRVRLGCGLEAAAMLIRARAAIAALAGAPPT